MIIEGSKYILQLIVNLFYTFRYLWHQSHLREAEKTMTLTTFGKSKLTISGWS